MRGWLLASVFAASGCLYLGDVNKPPSVSFSEAQQLRTNIGGALTLSAVATDDEDGSLPVSYTVSSGDDQQINPDCDYKINDVGYDDHGLPKKTIQFFRKGVFRVEATTQDLQGAPPVVKPSIMLAIDDSGPEFEPAAAPKPSMVVPTCGYFAPGDKIPIGLMGGHVDDKDTFGPCHSQSDGLTYTWHLQSPPNAKGVLTHYSNGCASATATSGADLVVGSESDQVCLVPDPNVSTPNTVYMVALEVADEYQKMTESKSVSIAVGPNVLPCITANTPATGRYVVDRTQPYWLSVAGAIDDRQTFYDSTDPIKFAWSLSTDSDPTWHDVPDYTASSYQLDPSSFGVGEVVHVRVEAVDDSGPPTTPPACAASSAPGDCDLLDTCIAAVCHRWRTWDLELR